MRPLELRLRNFRSYFGDEATFDFRDRSLIGVVGAIGSGKSSILDAISFALYGRTPAIAAATKSLIHQRAGDAAVALRFEVEGDVYEVVRSLRRKGASQHALYRYERDEDGDPVATITQEGEVNAAIVELLGLDFDAFSRSVLLAQGRFAEFLSAAPSERDRVLKGVFGHDRVDRMREVARQRAGTLALELAELSVRAEQLEGIAARLVVQRDQLDRLRQRLEVLSKAEPGVVDLEHRVAAGTKAREAAVERLAGLQEHADRLPVETTTDHLLRDVVAARTARANAASTLEEAASAVAAAEDRLKQAQSAGAEELIASAAARLAAIEPLTKSVSGAEARVARFSERSAAARESAAAAEKRVAAANESAEESAAALATATAAEHAAEEQLQAARHRDIAVSLQAELHVGDSCPVCLQQVDEVPVVAAVDLEAKQGQLDVAREAVRLAQAASARALAENTAAVEALESSRAAAEGAMSELEAAREEVEAHAVALQEQLGLLTNELGEGDPQQLLDELRRAQRSLVEALADARKLVDRVRTEHDTAIRAEQETDKRLAALRIDLVELAGRMDEEQALPGDDPGSVGEALAALRKRWAALVKDLQKVQSEAGTDIDQAQGELAAVLESLDVEGPLSSAIAAAEAQVELLDIAVSESETSLQQGTEILEERDRVAADRDRYERISTDLTNSRFIRYLLDDERSRLAELGSDHFARLSSGRYRFTDDGVFSIVDLTAADAVRKADSLSGGETFLASLALALALAEMVTRTGGRLDAFFLDEGFGALDPEHLDLAMEGVEALAADSGDRLVVVVSHVPELRLRLEDLIELDRDPTTGDTRVIHA